MNHSAGSIPVLSLFTGAGGLDYGFHRAGFSTILAIDHDEAATHTFNSNFPGQVARCADLETTNAHTILKWLQGGPSLPRGVIGGPPCQGFSIGNVNSDVNDPRNLLPFRYCEIINLLNAKFGLDFFVFENVLGLRSPKHRSRLEDIVDRLKQAGFEVTQGELDAQNFGVAQRRRRLFLVGVNKKKFPNQKYSLPIGNCKIQSVRKKIWGLPTPTFRVHGLVPSRIPYHENHWTSSPISKKFQNQEFNTGRSFRRLDWDQPSWTVAYGNREIHIHPDGERRLSILEAMLLQSFPRSFRIKGNFCAQVQQVSNAVPPLVARAVADEIKKQLFSLEPEASDE